MPPRSDVTAILNRLAQGHPEAADELWPLVYDELRGLAEGYFQNENIEHTLQPTALVNEAYIRLAGRNEPGWESRAQFFFVAARAMRHILIDHARRRRSAKRGGDRRRVILDEADKPLTPKDDDLLALNEALEKLGAVDAQLVKVVELHWFGGLTFDEVARALDVAPITAKRMWKLAKGWLRCKIDEGQ
jgi:RNA polymerase sigma factor (TIGR02999 family)